MTTTARNNPGRAAPLILGVVLAVVVLAVVVWLLTRGATSPNATIAVTTPPLAMEMPAATATPSVPTASSAASAPAQAVAPTAEPRAAEVPGWSGTLIWAEQGDRLQIRVEGESRLRTVQLIGIMTPIRSTREVTGQEPWGTIAHQHVLLMAVQKPVRVELDTATNLPGSNVVWGYVYLGDQMLNEVLLHEGLAVLDTRPPNVRYVERLQAAQSSARESQRGLWDPQRPLEESPQAFRDRLARGDRSETTSLEQNTIPAWEPGAFIGNRRSKVYHGPESRHYEQMKTSANAVFFRTAEDAEKAGFRRTGG